MRPCPDTWGSAMGELDHRLVWAVAWFAHPGLVALGALLACVPVIIHWWSRRRVRTLDWAAMRLLVGAVQRDERRVRLEDVALLALRVLAVLLLAGAVARPFLSRGSLASSLTGNVGGVEYVVLIDDSLSMRSVTSTGSAFERAKRRLREMVTTAADSGRDSLTLVLATSPRQPRLERVPLVPQRLDDLLGTIDRLEPTDAAVDWAATLVEFREWLTTRTSGVRRVLVASDFRRHDWINDRMQTFTFGDLDTSAADTASDASSGTHSTQRESENEEERWLLCDVGEPPTDNLYVTDLRADGVVATGVPLQYQATVGNLGDHDARNIEVRLTVAETAPLTATIDLLPAGETRLVSFPVKWEQAEGVWEVRVDITSSEPERDNRLATDDSTTTLASPGEGVSVAILASEDSRNAASRETPSETTNAGSETADFDLSADEKTLYLARSLSPDEAMPAGFLPRLLAKDRWDEAMLESFRLIIASDLRSFTVEQVEWLERWVRNGGSLLIAAGPTTDHGAWNTRLYREGRGLAPLGLVEIRGDERHERWQTMRQIRGDFAPLRLLAGDDNPFPAQIRVYQWWSTRGESSAEDESTVSETSTDRQAGTRILARLDDDLKSPWLADKEFGEGRVVQVMFPFDETWSDWPADPSFLIVVQELVRELAQDRRLPTSVYAGEPIRCRLPLEKYQSQAWPRTPSRQRLALEGATSRSPNSSDTSSSLQGKPSASLLNSPPTRHLGRHTVEVSRISGEREEFTVVVTAAPVESQLRRVGEEWGVLHAIRGARRIPADMAWMDADIARGDWSYWLLWSLAGILFCEQSLAYVVGQRR
ncbi:MAG: BatA domain-containing protein [Pirellulales bacterium]